MKLLLCLPPKPLFMFKLVSKRWMSTISSPYFSSIWKPRPTSGLFVSLSSKGNFSIKYTYISLIQPKQNPVVPLQCLDFIKDSCGVEILQSCGGLLFLCRSRASESSLQYYVYNPTTKHFSTFPYPNLLDKCPRISCLNLSFDLSKSPYCQVIHIYGEYRSNIVFHIETYTFETNTWRYSGGPFVGPVGTSFSKGVFLNGTLHWPTDYSETSVCYDVYEKNIRKFPMPPLQSECGRNLNYFGEVGGKLHAIDFTECNASNFDVFVMENDYSCWFKKYHIDLDTVAQSFPEMVVYKPDPWTDNTRTFLRYKVHSIIETETPDSPSLVLYIHDDKFISLNLTDNTLLKLPDLSRRSSDQQKSYFRKSRAFQYVENPFWI
ncbi:PREDICTED: F-box protein At5g07610-like [Nicotiana attenuata]|uniref:F-box protein n=1 Tax=Nicotiana attenuata TaxID=49451 RepID=A0A314L3P7_NICAT|nr:PREDICTED: F-box protein At5g07610-like [Nicotiana attenuata]OIT36173.1 f-box protein [Nicotiana attenuata]